MYIIFAFDSNDMILTRKESSLLRVMKKPRRPCVPDAYNIHDSTTHLRMLTFSRGRKLGVFTSSDYFAEFIRLFLLIKHVFWGMKYNIVFCCTGGHMFPKYKTEPGNTKTGKKQMVGYEIWQRILRCSDYVQFHTLICMFFHQINLMNSTKHLIN